MGHLRNDKGERSVFYRLVEVMPFNNWNYKLDTSCHNGIISIKIDADCVNSNDDDIGTKIIKTKKYIAGYLGNGHTIKRTLLGLLT